MRSTLRPGDVAASTTPTASSSGATAALRDGLDALSAVAAGVTARDAAGVGEELLSRLADHPEDDVAVVVVRVPSPAATPRGAPRSPRRRRWSLPSEAASIGRARHAVVRTCQAWGIADAANAELVVSELVANAVLHGYGHVSLQLYDTGDGLRIEVEDANPAPPVTTDGHPGRVGGFGMQIVERLADWGWRQSRGGKLVWAKVRPGRCPPAAARPGRRPRRGGGSPSRPTPDSQRWSASIRNRSSAPQISMTNRSRGSAPRRTVAPPRLRSESASEMRNAAPVESMKVTRHMSTTSELPAQTDDARGDLRELVAFGEVEVAGDRSASSSSRTWRSRSWVRPSVGGRCTPNGSRSAGRL